MKSLKRDTVAYQLGVRPYTVPASHTGIQTGLVASGVKTALSSSLYPSVGKEWTHRVSNPEVDALMFYLLNHAVAVATKKVHPLESLGKYMPLYEAYNLMLAEQTRRMFYYLVAICTRESRHNKASGSDESWKYLTSKYGPAAYDFHSQIRGKGSDTAVEIFCDTPPVMSLGKYTEYLCDSFYKGQYNSSYGGKAWGGIADVLKKFVHGELTAEMMLDTAFTLCHNNGPIFNKGMFYTSYTHEIYKILDVQRSGQIPQLVHSIGVAQAHDVRVAKALHLATSVLGDELFDGHSYVDWYQVEAMGSLKKYPHEKGQQKEVPANNSVVAKKKPKAAVPAMDMDDMEADEVDYPYEVPEGLEIMPGVYVKQTEVARES